MVDKSTKFVCEACGNQFQYTWLPNWSIQKKKRYFCSRECSYRCRWRSKESIEPVFDGDTVKIPLTQGQYALVDRSDYESISILRKTWFALWCPDTKSFYAKRKVGKNAFAMHDAVMNTQEGEIADHINFNTLDNRRNNLRIASKQQNVQHHRKYTVLGKEPMSRFSGVTIRPNGKWRARITFNDVRTHIGDFDNEVDAARAYNEKAKEFFGEFAHLNDV